MQLTVSKPIQQSVKFLRKMTACSHKKEPEYSGSFAIYRINTTLGRELYLQSLLSVVMLHQRSRFPHQLPHNQ